MTNEDIKRYLTAERDAMKTGYSIKTWKMRLFCPEKQMIETTEALYREAVAFYYELLKEREELWDENLLTIQGHLEKLTVPGRDGREPKYIPPGGKLPVYFRRSAMNKAAMAVKTAASAENFPKKIDANITFFKGMYKDLTDTSVVLKLWNGKKWIWVPCGLTGRPFPKEAAILSPTLVHEEKWLMFHVPVKQENSDARTAKERMQEGARVCSVRFTNTDSFAVCTVLDEGSRQLAVKNCRGGNAYRHHCRALLKKVEASRAFTDKDNVSQPNRKYYMHLKHLNEHYAHQVSKEIMDFCKENQTGILVLPEYDEDFSRISMYRSGNYSPLHLSIRIRNYLKYKAWAEGILVLELRADGTEKQCSICGATGKKQGSVFICQNGHQVNCFLNGARNLGRKCQESFRKNNKSS